MDSMSSINGLTAFGLLFFLQLGVSAQDESVVTVNVPYGNGHATGSGVVLQDIGESRTDGFYRSYVVTAAHVVDYRLRSDVSVEYRNGRTAKNCVVLAFDRDNDVAILLAITPNEIRPLAGIAACDEDDLLIVDGLRSFKRVRVALVQSTKIYLDGTVIQGDSGCPIYNQNRELVGIVSGGNIWLEGQDESKPKATWPVRAGGRKPIEALIEKVLGK
jgi:hypothetical protein